LRSHHTGRGADLAAAVVAAFAVDAAQTLAAADVVALAFLCDLKLGMDSRIELAYILPWGSSSWLHLLPPLQPCSLCMAAQRSVVAGMVLGLPPRTNNIPWNHSFVTWPVVSASFPRLCTNLVQRPTGFYLQKMTWTWTWVGWIVSRSDSDLLSLLAVVFHFFFAFGPVFVVAVMVVAAVAVAVLAIVLVMH